MHRRTGTVVIAAVMALGVIAGPAHEVSAAPNGHAVCVAENISGAHAALGGQEFAHVIVVPDAQDGGAGEFISPLASTDCGNR